MNTQPQILTAENRATHWVFLGPFLILALVFIVLPMLFSVVLSVMVWDPIDGFAGIHYVSLENYRFMFQDKWFWVSLYNTIWLALISGLAQHSVAIPLAYAICRWLGRYQQAVAGLFFLPYITSTVAISILATALFSTDYGLINQAIAPILHVISGTDSSQPIQWLDSPQGIKPAIAIIVFWRFVGFNTILYMAAFQAIPKEIFEVSYVDGIGSLRRFLMVAVPMIFPAILFGLTMSIIGGLQLFEEPFILTNGKGGASHAAMTVAMYMYRTAFEFNDIGTASAMAWFNFLLIAIILTLLYAIVGKRLIKNLGAT
jgi:multiple sugar transport system permease protein